MCVFHASLFICFMTGDRESSLTRGTPSQRIQSRGRCCFSKRSAEIVNNITLPDKASHRIVPIRIGSFHCCIIASGVTYSSSHERGVDLCFVSFILMTIIKLAARA